jgi:hypothetical protein
MNNVERIKAELKRLYNQSLVDENRQAELDLKSAACTSYGKSKACKELLSFINSMQEEPVSEDLYEAAENYGDELDNILAVCDDNDGDNTIGEYAKEAFKAGANWQKAQLLAGDAIKEVKGSFGGEIKVDLYAKLDNGEYIDFYPSMEPAPACDVKIGNRVRIIVMED